jgi:competence protein ComFC
MKLYKALRSIFDTGISFALETVAPKDPDIRSIEESGLEGFEKRAERLRPDADKDLICLYPYKNSLIKKSILDVKSHGNRAVAYILGQALHETLVEEIGERSPLENFVRPLLVPIPMTRESLRERGWNQCVILAEAFKRHDRANEFDLLPEALAKIRATEDQVGKGRKERFENLRDCFKASPIVKDRNVVVLDDIRTTGATLMEAKKALLAEGARKVICVALAR